MKNVKSRIALCVEYEGSQYHGWQIQQDQITVQAVLEQALSQIADHQVKVICAGRTDVGVHARGQIVHFDTHAQRDLSAWVRGSNSLLPPSIAVQWAQSVPADFHARYSAIARAYQYRIYNAPVRSAVYAKTATWHYKSLNADLMAEGAQYLIGTHDFTALRDAQCQAKTATRTLERLTVQRQGPFIIIDVQANAFLQHMVRNIAGVLLPVGEQVQTPQWVAEVLAGQDRRQAGITANPEGLTLMRVVYPENSGLAADPHAVYHAQALVAQYNDQAHSLTDALFSTRKSDD